VGSSNEASRLEKHIFSGNAANTSFSKSCILASSLAMGTTEEHGSHLRDPQ